MSYAELGRTVSLSAPAVAERVRRLERSGIIEGYHARVSPVALGRPITAYIRVAIEGTPSRQRRLVEHVESITSVEECHGLTGEDSYLIKVCVATTEELDRLTSTFSTYGRTTTSVVLSSPVVRAGITPG